MKGRSRLAAALLLLSVALLSAPSATAQTAEGLERILAFPIISYGEAAWVVLNAAGTALPEAAEASLENPGEFSEGGAYRFAEDNGWLPKKAAPHTPVTLGGVSFLIMKAFNMKGGLMYTLFPGSRYAYRELAYRKIITGRAYSTMRVSGERLLRLLGRALAYSGDTALPAAPVALAEVPPPAEESPPPAQAETEAPPPALPQIPPVKESPPPVKVETEAPPPALPQISPPVQEERERIVEIIHTELAERNITDTNVRTTTEGITISLNNIQFLPDSTELTWAEKQKLRDIAVILNRFPNRRILVGGHTALAGSAEGRMNISTDRAQAVADYLVMLGCRTRGQITVRGYGAERPLGDPATAAGQALNRRVEITLLDEGRAGNE